MNEETGRQPKQNDGAQTPKEVSTTRARQGVVGHNVRIVLFVSLAAVIIAFIFVALGMRQ